MLRKIKRILGMVPSPERWDEMKSGGLEQLLGKEHDMVMHALIPFAIGGGLDVYYYPQQRGFAIATKELIDEFGDGPRNAAFRAYEFTMFSPVQFDLEQAKDEGSAMGRAHDRLNRVLNALARYAGQATLNPNETMEFPADFGGGLGGQCLILDAFNRGGKSLTIGGKAFGLMLAINIHRDEMDFARAKGGAQLLAKLRAKGVYPYSDLERPSVV